MPRKVREQLSRVDYVVEKIEKIEKIERTDPIASLDFLISRQFVQVVNDEVGVRLSFG